MDNKESYNLLKENRNLKISFIIIFLAIIVGLIFIFRSYFWPFLFAVILYLVLRPLNDKIEGYLRSRSLSSFVLIFFIVILILVPVLFLLIALGDQIFQLYSLIMEKIQSGILQDLQNLFIVKKLMLYFNLSNADLMKKITDSLQSSAGVALSSITSLISYPLRIALNFFFMLLMLFFLLKDGYRLDDTIYATLPFPDDMEKDIFKRLKEVIRVLLTGNLLIMILQGFFLGLGFFIADVQMPLLWGSIAAILSLIPVVGTVLIWVPVAIFFIIKGFYGWAIFISVWSLFWYLFLENIIKPKVMGSKLQFHPLLFFFLLLGSISTFNLPGVLVGPILLTLFYSFWEIYKLFDEYDLHNKMNPEKDE